MLLKRQKNTIKNVTDTNNVISATDIKNANTAMEPKFGATK